MAAADNAGLTPEQVDIFARGLYYLASLDGIEPREADLIAEFLRDTGAAVGLDELKSSAFSPIEAAQVLETYLRRIFIKTAFTLVRADGQVTYPERRALAELADVFGITNVDLVELEHESVGLSSA